jgi:hypothetical protein
MKNKLPTFNEFIDENKQSYNSLYESKVYTKDDVKSVIQKIKQSVDVPYIDVQKKTEKSKSLVIYITYYPEIDWFFKYEVTANGNAKVLDAGHRAKDIVMYSTKYDYEKFKFLSIKELINKLNEIKNVVKEFKEEQEKPSISLLKISKSNTILTGENLQGHLTQKELNKYVHNAIVDLVQKIRKYDNYVSVIEGLLGIEYHHNIDIENSMSAYEIADIVIKKLDIIGNVKNDSLRNYLVDSTPILLKTVAKYILKNNKDIELSFLSVDPKPYPELNKIDVDLTPYTTDKTLIHKMV